MTKELTVKLDPARRTRERRPYLGLGILLVLFLSACGGGSDVAIGPASDGDEPAGVDETAEAETDTEVDSADPEPVAGDDGDAASQGDPTVSSASGGGVVVVDGVSYTVVNEICFSSPGNFFSGGPASSDGEFGNAWIEISGDVNEDYDDDGKPDVTADVTIEHGRTDSFGSADDGAPDLFAFRIEFSTQPAGINEGVLDFEINGSAMTGSGELSDGNGVLIPFGEVREFTFESSCA